MTINYDHFAADLPKVEPIESLHVVANERVSQLKIRDAIPALIAQPECSDDPEIFSQLLALLISSLETSGDRQTTDRLTNAARIRIAHRAQGYIEHHFQQPVHMGEVCQETGAGLRRLSVDFRKQFGKTPSETLRCAL
jgi:AraC-like DNA-binding protein